MLLSLAVFVATSLPVLGARSGVRRTVCASTSRYRDRSLLSGRIQEIHRLMNESTVMYCSFHAKCQLTISSFFRVHFRVKFDLKLARRLNAGPSL